MNKKNLFSLILIAAGFMIAELMGHGVNDMSVYPTQATSVDPSSPPLSEADKWLAAAPPAPGQASGQQQPGHSESWAQKAIGGWGFPWRIYASLITTFLTGLGLIVWGTVRLLWLSGM
jgi:hypothetical protein